MSDFQTITDRVEIEALRSEFTDAVMMRDYDRLASLFTPDGALRMPNIPAELVGRERGYRLWWISSCRTRTRARSGWTATPRPAVPTCKSWAAPATAAQS